MVAVSTSNTKLKGETFLKGMGGMRMFFLAGILMTWQPYSTLNRSLRQTIFGISHFAQICKKMGTVFSSCTDRVPSMV